jgi:hypothetical protein
LGDKADLFQEKGDKSITLNKFNAIGVPFFSFVVFLKKSQHRRGLYPFSIFSRMPPWVQFFVLPGSPWASQTGINKILFNNNGMLNAFKKIVPSQKNWIKLLLQGYGLVSGVHGPFIPANYCGIKELPVRLLWPSSKALRQRGSRGACWMLQVLPRSVFCQSAP